MGIPSFFSHLVKNHGNILKKIKYLNKTINNLYLDSNSIIYDSYYSIKNEYKGNDDVFEKILIIKVCEKIEEYILELKPTNRVIIAYDGVAPVAKMEQQRNRRYKSMLERKLKKELYPEGNSTEWKTTAITPGTMFMKKLDIMTQDYFNNNEKRYNLNEIIVSGTNIPGEGEHKLFEKIRNDKKHKNECTIIYGLDADLIMLALNHLPISKQIYLYRETPEFIKSINIELNPNESYILDIPELSQTIISTMNNGRQVNNKQQSNRLYDYIFLCFFLGNDFLPHFPAVNIRTKGIEIMLNSYKKIFGDTNQNLTNGKKIYWNNVNKLIQDLSEDEWKNLINEYKIRDRQEKYVVKDEDSMTRYLKIPVRNRDIEKYIAPYIPQWQQRYYKKLFDSEGTPDYIKKVSINYLEGLEWVMKYYTTGCIDWNWHYKYYYPPLLSDLIKYTPKWDIEFIEKNNHGPVRDLVQLSYVLPKDSLEFLPNELYNYLIWQKKDNYKDNCEIKWSFCKYIWESHVVLPLIDIEDLKDKIYKMNLE